MSGLRRCVSCQNLAASSFSETVDLASESTECSLNGALPEDLEEMLLHVENQAMYLIATHPSNADSALAEFYNGLLSDGHSVDECSEAMYSITVWVARSRDSQKLLDGSFTVADLLCLWETHISGADRVRVIEEMIRECEGQIAKLKSIVANIEIVRYNLEAGGVEMVEDPVVYGRKLLQDEENKLERLMSQLYTAADLW